MNAGLFEVRCTADGTLAARSRAKIRHVPLQGQLHQIYQISRAWGMGSWPVDGLKWAKNGSRTAPCRRPLYPTNGHRPLGRPCL